jgi:hypothetical protein
MNADIYEYETNYSGAELMALYGEETDPELLGFLSLILPALTTRFIAKKAIKKLNPKLAKKLDLKRKAVVSSLTAPFRAIKERRAARKAARAEAAYQAEQSAEVVPEAEQAAPVQAAPVQAAATIPGDLAGMMKNPKILLPIMASAGFLLFTLARKK